MKRATTKKVFTLAIALVMAFSILITYNANVMRSVAETPPNVAKLSDVEFWSTYSTEKVFQDVVVGYEDIKQQPAVQVSAVRGEEEATQLIMTTGEKPVRTFDVVKSDLTDENGNVYSKDDFTVYHQKYIYVSGGNEYYTQAAYYPDCLVPFDNVKALKENVVNAKNNQGLYISFDIPYGQVASTYTGTIGIVIEGETKSIPVNLRVVNAEISKETHMTSVFLNEWDFHRGELDSTEEMYDTYNRTLFDYRLGCSSVVLAYKDIDYYAQRVCEYSKLPECAGYNIPHKFLNCSGKGIFLNGRELTLPNAYDPDLMKKYMLTIAYEGLKQNVDPFKKAVIYGYDEPSQNFEISYPSIDVADALSEWAYIVRQCKNSVIEQLLNDGSVVNKELLKTIVESLDAVPHVITESKRPNTEIDFENEDIVYAPLFNFVSTDAARDKFRVSEDNQLWWYGCNAPTYPYPTYHIDDTVLSARIVSWMQADYNIAGNLYWSTDIYRGVSAAGTSMYLEDYYQSSYRGSELGEGWLFYPGARYGVYGPLPSVRLEQIRDGVEEYDMIYALGEVYKSVSQEVGVDFNEDQIMGYLYQSLYNGTKVNANSDTFAYQRSSLLDLIELAQSKARVCIMSASASLGAYKFEIYADNGYILKQNGQEVLQKRVLGNGYVYTINTNLSSNYELDFTVEVDQNILGFRLELGNSAQGYDAEYAFNNNVISRRNNVNASTVETVLVDATTVNPNALDGEKYVQIKMGQTNNDNLKSEFVLKDSSIKSIDGTCKKLAIRIYNSSSESIDAGLAIRYGNNLRLYSVYSDFVINSGENVILIAGLDSFKWRQLLYIDEIKIELGKPRDPARDCIYFMDMSIYK